MAQLSKIRPAFNLPFLSLAVARPLGLEFFCKRCAAFHNAAQLSQLRPYQFRRERIENDLIVFLEDLDARPFLDAKLFAQRGRDDDLPLLGSTCFLEFYHTRKV